VGDKPFAVARGGAAYGKKADAGGRHEHVESERRDESEACDRRCGDEPAGQPEQSNAGKCCGERQQGAIDEHAAVTGPEQGEHGA